MPHGDPDPITYLEPDQLRADRSQPLPRAHLGAGVTALLWVLRIAVIVLGAMVIWVFAHTLG